MTTYIFRWDRHGRKDQRCVVLARGTMNSCLVRFEDGYMMVTSRNALGIKVPFNPTVAAETVSLRREPFLFLFAGREVRLPSRRRALLARGSGDRLDLFFFRLLLLPIASLACDFAANGI